MPLAEVLEDMRARSRSKSGLGTSFENLVSRWLLADPVQGGQLASVWSWRHFPGRFELGETDLGIDLVARSHDGEYWAIQCKFHGGNTEIAKREFDSFLASSSRIFTDPATGRQTGFSRRLWISTSDRFTPYAAEMSRRQSIPVTRITCRELAASPVDWEALYHGRREKRIRKTPRPDQLEAVAKSAAHFGAHDRGRLIMACGTGKTYASLLIAEKIAHRSVLVLVPSIALVNQMVNAWMGDSSRKLHPICVCSDPGSSRLQDEDSVTEDLSSLILPATTSPEKVAQRFLALDAESARDGGLTVIFSTYQSIDAVAEAQKAISEASGSPHSFDLIICDEAHRTTGIVRPGEGQSDFTKIHDHAFIRGRKRLYMTATPRLFGDSVKARARQSDFELCSMDDESIYGKEIHRTGFGFAVDHGLLTDYKVLVLTVGSLWQLPQALREQVQDPDCKELDFSVSSKLVGCVNGLAKNSATGGESPLWEDDPGIMRRAIVFCGSISKKGDSASSKNIERILPAIARSVGEDGHRIRIEARHIDGTMDAAVRADALMWLGGEIRDPDECRILTNVRCLSEGIDVPALDAAIFLSPRNSQIDVVQSVGRVMRNFRRGEAGGKKFGYIIIPIVVNPNIPPEEALEDNAAFAMLWSILNALRAHDERFNAMINSIALNRERPDRVHVSFSPFYGGDGEGMERLGDAIQGHLAFLNDIDGRLYAKMVEKVGSRLYWERWAKNMAPLARSLVSRTGELVAARPDLAEAFQKFVQALRGAINGSVTERQASEMLAQHLITRPVFEALFADYAFEENNAVTRAMKRMTDLLIEAGLEKDTASLNDFYGSVKRNLGEVKTLEGRQTVIKNLYDSFFRGAFPLAVEQLGIVYTPVECVDFILRSVDAALKKEFGLGLTDKGVHILDPFTGTGTFITRLLQSGLIKREDLERKYLHEIHCNEIMLLAYYVADVNIESVYHELSGKTEYQRFDGICLTDTFALKAMETQPDLYPFLLENFKSMEEEAKAPIRVIIGNPPYSFGQKSGNDNAQNLKYPVLDKRIEETYAAASIATSKQKLYDSYIRAFRWASDRLRQNNEGGVIGFITNGGWLDGNAAAGFRKCLEEEFSAIYIMQLRGDARTQGELRRKEGGNVFGGGSRAPVVITILVYNPAHKGKARIHYADIGDYLTREQKLKIISERSSIFDSKIEWRLITPDTHGDWLKQRSDLFGQFIAIGDKKDKADQETFFEPVYSLGLNSNRDAWVYNFSKDILEKNIKRTITFYNEQCDKIKNGGEISLDPRFFSWTDPTRAKVHKNIKFSYQNGHIVPSAYRPFCKEFLYFSQELNHRPGQWPQLFPTAETKNRVICISGLGGSKNFTSLVTNKITDLNMLDAGTQCFPLYYYRQKSNAQGNLLGNGPQYQRHDAITDWILENIRGRFGNARNITKETIFYYVYGILHSPEYRTAFSNDLKKLLPRIPIVERVEDFIAFSEAGRKLAELHLDYENAPPCADVIVTGADRGNFIVEKMKFGGRQGAWDRSRIIYNSGIEICNIPLKAYEYVVNGRSAIEWIMESYRVRTDRDSGIRNDPNSWSAEHGRPRYILDLLLSVIGLSVTTLEIVESLPKLEFGAEIRLPENRNPCRRL